MAHETSRTDTTKLTSEEQERLAKLLNHPDLDEFLKKLEEKKDKK